MGYKYIRDENGNRVKVPLSEEEQRRLDEQLAPMRAAHAHADLTLGKLRPGVGIVDCPRCKTGKLHYHVASNGHMWCMCSTKGCASWME
jgi:hypothetical protein